MDLSDVELRLDSMNEVLGILVEGFKQRDQTMANHTAILVHQTKLLTEIKAILTAEPEEESPLLMVIKQLVHVVDGQTAILNRIEKALTKPGAP